MPRDMGLLPLYGINLSFPACCLPSDQIKLQLLSRIPPGGHPRGPVMYLGSSFGSCFKLLGIDNRSLISPGLTPIKSNCHCSRLHPAVKDPVLCLG